MKGGAGQQNGPGRQADDFRFVRGWWEVPVVALLSPDGHQHKWQGPYCVLGGYRWFPFAKGGAFSPYYADIHLLVNWKDDGKEIKELNDPKSGRLLSRPQNTGYYFKPGLTWPRRTTSGISVRALPIGCIFADKGPTAFVDEKANWLGLLQSSIFSTLIGLQLSAADAAARSYEVGLIQRTPVPNATGANWEKLGELAQSSIDLKRSMDTANENSHAFIVPPVLQVTGGSLVERTSGWASHLNEIESTLMQAQASMDDLAYELYGIDKRSISDNESVTDTSGIGEYRPEEDSEDAEELLSSDSASLVTDLLSYSLGVVYGRWDIRLATGERPLPELTDPFAPLPICSPGMLQGDDGYPLCETPSGYPLNIKWDGILVDDPDHSEDIVSSARNVLEILWEDNVETIEREVCEILAVRELRDYFRKPGNGGFWMDHVRRYSKSRRKAPIYWLLQSSKRNYAIWLYYPRLDKDILFKALMNYVEPKLRLEANRLEQIRAEKASAGTSGRVAKQLEKIMERQESLLSELHDFQDKLRRVADLHLVPDLNDGVILNIAPLWELVPWNDAKKYWQELLAGKYQWSSISKQLYEKNQLK